MEISITENYGISDDIDWGGNKWDNVETEEEVE